MYQVDFGQIIRVPKNAFPPNCDYINQGYDPEDQEFVKRCFMFLSRFIRKGTMNLEAKTFEKTNFILEDSATSTSLRILQTDTFISIVPVTEDSTSCDQTFSNVVLTPGDIIVDGSTSLQAGSASDGVNQINSIAATIDTSSTSSSSYLSLSFIFCVALELLF